MLLISQRQHRMSLIAVHTTSSFKIVTAGVDTMDTAYITQPKKYHQRQTLGVCSGQNTYRFSCIPTHPHHVKKLQDVSKCSRDIATHIVHCTFVKTMSVHG